MRPAWRPLLRETSTYLLVGLSVALLVQLVWWTRHPASPSLSVVREWPVVGALAGRLQDRYSPPAAVARPGDEARAVEGVAAAHGFVTASLGPESGPPLGSGPGSGASLEVRTGPRSGGEPLVEYELVYEPREPRPYIWVAEGAALRKEPSFDAEPVHRMDAMTNLFVEERRGDWARVRHRGVDAWVMKPRGGSGERHGNRPAPVLPIPGHPPDVGVEERAMAAMSGRARAFDLGPYRGLTDTDVGPLVDRCRGAVSGLEAIYVEAIGLRPLGTTEERLFAFGDRRGYTAFYAGGLRSDTGHAGNGYAALVVGGRSATDACTTILHEAVHLLNRRAIGPALPPWLDEGLAAHLRSLVAGGRVTSAEAEAARTRGALPSLRTLAGLDEDAYHARRESLHYELSALWVEYLLGDPELAPRFRSFLAYLAGGGPWSHAPSPEGFDTARATTSLGDDLLYFLARDDRVLDAGFRAWLWGRR